MGEHDDSEIIEHHVEEEMEKKGAPSSSSFLESVTPSDREGHSGTQSSHRLLAYSDALISIIATVMVRLRASRVKKDMLGRSLLFGLQRASTHDTRVRRHFNDELDVAQAVVTLHFTHSSASWA